jgi:hypothetical protein
MRLYSNTAVATVLAADIASTGSTIQLGSVTGWPVPGYGDSALAALDYGGANVELVEYGGITGTSLTGCTRAVDGTPASAHLIGATVRHTGSGIDLQLASRYGEFLPSGLLSGQLYGPNGIALLTTAALAVGELREGQFFVPSRTTFNSIGIEVTAAVGGAFLRLMVYGSTGTGKPTIPILDAGTVNAGTSGYKTIAINLTLARGLYHPSVLAEGVGCTIRVSSVHTPPVRLPQASGTASVTSAWRNLSTPTGAAPNPFPATMALTSSAPLVLLGTV